MWLIPLISQAEEGNRIRELVASDSDAKHMVPCKLTIIIIVIVIIIIVIIIVIVTVIIIIRFIDRLIIGTKKSE